MDLEAAEMLIRSAMYQAGASVLTELLRFPEPDQRAILVRAATSSIP